MRIAVRILLMALVWAALKGSFSLMNLLTGAVLGGLVLWFVRPLQETEPTHRSSIWHLRRVWRFAVLIGVFLWELLMSSLQVAYAVLQPKLRITPGIIALPLDAKTDLEITLLANLISLTPGTLSLDVSPDKQTLYIHAMFLEDEEAEEVRAHIKRRLEHYVIRALGRSAGPG